MNFQKIQKKNQSKTTSPEKSACYIKCDKTRVSSGLIVIVDVVS